MEATARAPSSWPRRCGWPASTRSSWPSWTRPRCSGTAGRWAPSTRCRCATEPRVRAVVQRVSRARVLVDGAVVGSVDRPGLCVLVGVTHSDGAEQVATLSRKIAELRILADERSALDAGAPVLVVSQFTLYADTRKGRRPSWSGAAPAAVAEPLVQAVVDAVRDRGLEVATGRFGARMELELVNDGPVTLVLEA